MKAPTPAKVRSEYIARNHGHYFDRSTMRFFGDTMKSFGCRMFEGKPVWYRKLLSPINVFGRLKLSGINEVNPRWVNDDFDFECMDDESEKRFLDSL